MTATSELQAWLNGTATGGPNADGRYPLTGKDGVTVLVYCPAAQALNPAVSEAPIEVFSQNASTAAADAANSAAAAAAAANNITTNYLPKAGGLMTANANVDFGDNTQGVGLNAAHDKLLLRGWSGLQFKQTSSGVVYEVVHSGMKGAPDGVASLDASGQIPSIQLPSYVDDVLEFPALTNFPTTGVAGKIYIAADTSRVYRWTGSAYLWINSSVGSADTAASVPWTGVTGKPTTLAGYGITDAANLNTSNAFAGNVRVGTSASNGYVTLETGAPNTPGYVGFYTQDSIRRGYIGWQSGTTNINLASENGWNYNFTQRPLFNGATPWDSGNFDPSSRAIASQGWGTDANAFIGMGMAASSASTTTNTPASSWTQLLSNTISNGAWGYQLAHAWFDEDLYIRSVQNGTWKSWRKLWHDGNLTPVDAGTNSTITGSKIFTSPPGFYIGGVNTQQVLQGFGWNNTVPRWKTVIEADGSFSMYGYDTAGGTPTSGFNVKTAPAGGVNEFRVPGRLYCGTGDGDLSFSPTNDADIWDVNIPNTLGIKGAGGSTQGYISFGNAGANKFGWDGVRHVTADSIVGAGELPIAKGTIQRAGLQNNTTLGAGFYTTSDGLPNANNTAAIRGAWWHVINMHHFDNNGFNAQIACELSSAGANAMLLRTSSGGAWREWSEMWHTSNAPAVLKGTLNNVGRYHSTDLTTVDNARNEQGFNYGTGGAPWTGPSLTFGGDFGSSNYPGQFQMPYTGSGLAYRSRNGDTGAWNPWCTAWDSGNLAAPSVSTAGSTLVQRSPEGYVYTNYFNCTADVTGAVASHLAVQTGSDNYIRWKTPAAFFADHGVALTGGATFTGNLVATAGTNNNIANMGGEGLSVRSQSNAGAAAIAFHRIGAYATYLGIDTDNKLKLGGWSAGAVAYEIWHSGNVPIPVQSDGGDITKLKKMTQAAYDALTTKDANTLYVIVG